MTKSYPLQSLTIKGFKSIVDLDKFTFTPLNVVIGANGAGKTNLVEFFRMLREMMEGRLQLWTREQGSAGRIVSFGVKRTSKINAHLHFWPNAYTFDLQALPDGGFAFSSERTYFDGPYYGESWSSLGTGHLEAKLPEATKNSNGSGIVDYCFAAISNWKVYHFHDTSAMAGVKQKGSVHDNTYLRPDASNLAAFLFRIQQEFPVDYEKIKLSIRLALPFFDDFIFQPTSLPDGEQQINLQWQQIGSDYPFWPSQLSDGSIRFICLVTALLQPIPPTSIIIDEPELGLHPYAITLLAGLLKSASKRMQVIVSTQSVPLVNEFEIEDLIVVDRENGASLFRRHKQEDFEKWLEDYTLGELWQKNYLGARPRIDNAKGEAK